MRAAAASAVMAAGLVLPLAPWTVRNWVEIHRFDPLARRYADLPSEYAPDGFYAWTATWLWRFEDVERLVWSLDEQPMHVEDVPGSAFDSMEERERLRTLFEGYDRTTRMTAEVDAGFAEIARERTARRPWRTLLTIPALRALTLWLTPRVDMLPVADGFLPVAGQWENDPQGYCLLAGFTLLDVLYIAVALAGAWAARARPGARLLVAFIAVRTAFLAGFALTPEPRYVVECFPAVIALGAQLGYLRERRPS